ncbi:MAG: single-stranded-DNA-specific exonuclease RecJ [bacterium]
MQDMERVWLVSAGGGGIINEAGELREVLLAQRGVASSEREAFFEPRYNRDIHDPYLMFDMEVAVGRIRRAVEKKECIVIYGDYDADGISSMAVLIDVLKMLGANVSPYLPHRLNDGYGLRMSVLRKLAVDADLLITVDCGVSDYEEVAWLMAQGIDVIVTDHHNLPAELPQALAILHPRHPRGRYPFGYLCGAGVAWKLAQALLEDREMEKWLLDLVCLGTVADMVPMMGENKAIVSFGLRVLRRSNRPGLRKLVQTARRGSDVLDADTVGYRVVPLMNAPGRLEHGQPVLDLLLTQEERRADELVAELVRYNRSRSTLSRQVEREVTEQIGKLDGPILFASGSQWAAGVVGLVAGRLCERFARPAIVVGGGNGHAVGSARAPAGLNVFKLIADQEEHLLNYGGHPSAAGFSLEYDKVDKFSRALAEKAGQIKNEINYREEQADAIVEHNLLNWDTAEMLEQFSPYGEGNKRPKLVGRQLELADWRLVGKTKEHVKFVFRNGDEPLDGIGFGLADDELLKTVKSGESVDVLFYLDINEFKGRRGLQLQIRDIAPAGRVKIVVSH